MKDPCIYRMGWKRRGDMSLEVYNLLSVSGVSIFRKLQINFEKSESIYLEALVIPTAEVYL